jgi:phage-related protein
MAAPTLNDYEYQFKDTGVLLNQANVSIPFWDVTKVSGLVDFPNLDVKESDIDGRHGTSYYAKYFGGRTVVVEGTLYASSSDFDTPVESLRTSAIPDGNDYPFYFKHPNKTQRYLMAKATTFKCDVDTGRRIGQASFQFQLSAGDPRHYIDGTAASWTTAVAFNLTNNGNTTVAPLISITATSTTTANITVQDVTSGGQISFSTAVTSGQVLTVDVENKLIKVAGSLRTAAVTLTGATDWPNIAAGATESWKVTSNVGNGTATNKSAWL